MEESTLIAEIAVRLIRQDLKDAGIAKCVILPVLIAVAALLATNITMVFAFKVNQTEPTMTINFTEEKHFRLCLSSSHKGLAFFIQKVRTA